ncbi:hypothetical protein LPJ66_002349 [Kickxella alabastrina]|uniref:Uncharacterized protein n=1 Tax=Kickxella alabastrina TaxID=61397 RepID=A0ACC1IQR1_9FUNG|nr:hypothetical protein LPJ66_002349 [Kickxella alabastrina]
MKFSLFLTIICVALVFFQCGSCVTEDQKLYIRRLNDQLSATKVKTAEENKLLRNLSVALNDRTALVALLTDPDSASYKAGLISLAQAVKLYAWISRDDQALMQTLQGVANRLRYLLLTP